MLKKNLFSDSQNPSIVTINLKTFCFDRNKMWIAILCRESIKTFRKKRGPTKGISGRF